MHLSRGKNDVVLITAKIVQKSDSHSKENRTANRKVHPLIK